MVVLQPIYSWLFLHSRDDRHSGMQQNEQNNETANESPEYDV